MTSDDIVYLEPDDQRYPRALRGRPDAPERIAVLGNLDILTNRLLALFCSVSCPGSLVLQTYDVARNLRDQGTPVIGGFHSPMEKECLALLLRGRQPLVICPARSMDRMRIPAAWRKPLADGRLLILSPFEKRQKRITVGLAAQRNEFVAALADRVFISYAAPGGKTERFCRSLLGSGKPLLTLQSDENAGLIALGVRPVRPDGMRVS